MSGCCRAMQGMVHSRVHLVGPSALIELAHTTLEATDLAALLRRVCSWPP